MNARFEFGGNYIEVCKFAHSREEFENGNQYNCVYDLRVKIGEFSGIGDCECDIGDFRKLIDELKDLYEFKRDTVNLYQDGASDTDVEFVLGKTGKITVYGTADSFGQKLVFEFEADQTALPPFINGLVEILKEQGYE